MLGKIEVPYSAQAADHADRLRLAVCDLRLLDLAIAGAVPQGDDQQALLMRLRDVAGNLELLSDDIIEASSARQEGGAS